MEVKDSDDDSPLIRAWRYQKLESMRLLLERGANVEEVAWTNESSSIKKGARGTIDSIRASIAAEKLRQGHFEVHGQTNGPVIGPQRGGGGGTRTTTLGERG